MNIRLTNAVTVPYPNRSESAGPDQPIDRHVRHAHQASDFADRQEHLLLFGRQFAHPSRSLYVRTQRTPSEFGIPEVILTISQFRFPRFEMVMESVRVRTKQPEVRRDQLLDAAERLFAEKGFADTTVADISEAAGVAKGTFYLYFPSKEHCVLALKERLSQGMMDRFLAVLDPALEELQTGRFDVASMTRRLIDESFEYAQEHADTFRQMFHRADTIEIDREHIEAEETVIATLTAAIAQLKEAGVADVSHPHHTARILFSGIHWALDHLLCYGEVDQSQVADLKEAAIEVSVRAMGSTR